MGKKKNKQAKSTDEALVIAPSMTRCDRVMAALELADRYGRLRYLPDINAKTPDGWVDGWVLCHPGIGGSEGLRRVRELRAQGQPIEMRPHPIHGRTTRQYRVNRPATLL